MTHSRFLPSAGLLLAIAACAPEFAVTLPGTLDSLVAMGGWESSDDTASPSEPTEE